MSDLNSYLRHNEEKGMLSASLFMWAVALAVLAVAGCLFTG